ncbi:hypothetical protein FD754_007078 [Muntiacus muntjak]|uniref:Uncharacterized protein n=1 Tax=Muntiacus muntjak TaxID=9888 RepID=A0A5N3WM82_MUNMU|nr:hypothetical protein FD754_007078 [Muntiacus muntjak]
MDATTAPHRIPPQMPQYGEANHVFELMQNMLEQLLIHQPKDPIPFMIDHLQRDNDYVPKIIILGPPASGKTTIAMWLAKHLSTNLLSVESLMAKEYSPLAADARMHYQKFKGVDGGGDGGCSRVLLPTVTGLASFLLCPVALSAPDTVLIERNLGKRIDPQTGEIYHTTFDWPPESEIQNRLMMPAGISEGETARKLLEYHRNIVRILPSYPKILKVINADQPCVDVFYQALTYVQTSHRSNAPFTPRVLLCGPVGSGKSLQAALLAQKYSLINVPDNIIMKVLKQRLDQQDCVERGWVLHGFPRDLDQAHVMDSLGYKPNSYFLYFWPVLLLHEAFSSCSKQGLLSGSTCSRALGLSSGVLGSLPRGRWTLPGPGTEPLHWQADS